MVIITDEKKHAERMIEEGFLLREKLSFELGILYKYYKSFGVHDKEIQEKLHDFCKFWLRDKYNYVKFIKIIERVSNFSKKGELKETNALFFTESEIEVLKKIDNFRIRKVLYILMFFGKIEGSGYCNAKETEIFKLARVVAKASQRTDILRWLYVNGYTKPTLSGTERVLCIDNSEGSKVAFFVEKYEDPLVYFLSYEGEKKVRTCEGCGNLFLSGSNRGKWCSRCQKEKRLEGWRESKRRREEDAESLSEEE